MKRALAFMLIACLLASASCRTKRADGRTEWHLPAPAYTNSGWELQW